MAPSGPPSLPSQKPPLSGASSDPLRTAISDLALTEVAAAAAAVRVLLWPGAGLEVDIGAKAAREISVLSLRVFSETHEQVHTHSLATCCHVSNTRRSSAGRGRGRRTVKRWLGKIRVVKLTHSLSSALAALRLRLPSPLLISRNERGRQFRSSTAPQISRFFWPQMYLSLKLESENCSRIITPFAVEKNGDELKWRGGTGKK